jgi:hypothetical protein
MKTLWRIDIHPDDWEYDRFEGAVVWADTAEEAEQIMRREVQYAIGDPPTERLWIENPDWRLVVAPAATEGVALAYFHAG